MQNKLLQITALLVIVVACVGLGVLLAPHLSTTGDTRYMLLLGRLDTLDSKIAGFEDTLDSLGTQITQLHLTTSAGTDYAYPAELTRTQIGEPLPGIPDNQPDTYGESPIQYIATQDKVEAPTDAELASITLIVDKLRARDYAYPNFPALMSSSEMAELGPAAKDMVMVEIAQLFENGQIDPTFFPAQ